MKFRTIQNHEYFATPIAAVFLTAEMSNFCNKTLLHTFMEEKSLKMRTY